LLDIGGKAVKVDSFSFLGLVVDICSDDFLEERFLGGHHHNHKKASI